MTNEQWIEIGGLLVGIVGGREAIAQGLKWWAGYRERRAQAREAIAKQEVEHDERTEDRLWARLERVESAHRDLRKHADDCHQALAEQSALNQTLLQANADCEQRYVSLEGRVARTEERTSDMTGRIRTEVRKQSQQGIPVQREIRKPGPAKPDVVGRIPPAKRKGDDDGQD